jgi:hypothetical protein
MVSVFGLPEASTLPAANLRNSSIIGLQSSVWEVRVSFLHHVSLSFHSTYFSVTLFRPSPTDDLDPQGARQVNPEDVNPVNSVKGIDKKTNTQIPFAVAFSSPLHVGRNTLVLICLNQKQVDATNGI